MNLPFPLNIVTGDPSVIDLRKTKARCVIDEEIENVSFKGRLF